MPSRTATNRAAFSSNAFAFGCSVFAVARARTRSTLYIKDAPSNAKPRIGSMVPASSGSEAAKSATNTCFACGCPDGLMPAVRFLNKRKAKRIDTINAAITAAFRTRSCALSRSAETDRRALRDRARWMVLTFLAGSKASRSCRISRTF